MDDIRLTPEMMAALRRLILGHTGTDAAQLAADRAEAAIEAEYVNSTGLLAEMVRSWIESDEFAATWRSNPSFARASEGALTASMVGDLRDLVLGRTPMNGSATTDVTDPAAAEELAYITRSEDLSGIVRSWIESDEFFEMWSRNETFRRVQGFEQLSTGATEERLLVHIHIPKTAGTSLNKAIEAHLPFGTSFAQRTPAELLAMPIGRLASARFIAGHFGFTIIELLRFRDPYIVTMARDPHEQIPSMWRFLRREGRIPDDLRFEDWIKHATEGPGRNPQTRALVRMMQMSGVTDSTRGWIFPPIETDEMLAEALDRRFGEVDLAAPSERVADLYRRIVRDCALPGEPAAEFPHLNTTDRAPISDEGRELIDSVTQLDRRFYELCTERWEADA